MRFLSTFPFLVLSIFSFHADASADESNDTWRLAPIIREGTPSDAVSADPVLPSVERQTSHSEGTGSIQRSLENGLALPVTDTGRPGLRSQFLGLGRDAEDTDVQALGVPLNPAQGGGFDFSTFPQFLWSGYRFHAGPSEGVVDPRGVAGTLVLIPRTQQALSRSRTGGSLEVFDSSLNLRQYSLFGQSSDRVAAVAGFTQGVAQGPSGALSGKWGSGKLSGRYHLLATRMDIQALGPDGSNPRARQITARVVPVIQSDWEISSQALLKTSLFFDGSYLRYDDPDDAFLQSRDQIRQGGVSSALLIGNWKYGLSLRQSTYHGVSFEAPRETTAVLQASRLIELESGTSLDPNIQAVGVSRTGIFPEASLGARQELGSRDHAVFARGSFSRRFPSLINRYSVYGSFFHGNPSLQPEKDWTGILGAETRSKRWELSIQGLAQLRQGSQIPIGGTVENLGQGRIYSVIESAEVRPTDFLGIHQMTTWAQSHLDSTGTDFPYVPKWTEILGARLHDVDGPDPQWEMGANFRAASSALGTFRPYRVKGYGYLDLSASYALFRAGEGHPGLSAVGRMDNVFDRNIEFTQGYPTPGRVFSLALRSDF